MMVGRDVLLRVEKEPAQPRRAAARGRGPRTCVDDRGLPAVDGVSLQVRGGEIVGARRHRRQRPERAHRRDHRAARRRRPARSRRRARTSPAAASRRRCAGGRRPHRRGPPPARAGARLLAGREPRAARLPERRCRASGCSRRARMRRARRRLLEEYDVRGGSPSTPRVAVGRQPAEGRHRARDRRRPEAAGRRAADARAGRRRDRVRPPPAARRARRGPRRSCSSRSSSRRSARWPTASW